MNKKIQLDSIATEWKLVDSETVSRWHFPDDYQDIAYLTKDYIAIDLDFGNIVFFDNHTKDIEKGKELADEILWRVFFNGEKYATLEKEFKAAPVNGIGILYVA